MISIGIDLGTTTISAVVFETGSFKGAEPGKLLEARTIPGSGFLKTPYEWERLQDPEKICARAQTLLEELLRAYPQTLAIGLTGQMHGIVYIDREGRSVSPLYTWQDKRGNLPEFGPGGKKTLAEWVREETESQVYSGYGLMTHLYHCKKGLIPPESAGICTIADYLGMRLTGSKRPLMHISNGASLGFFDSREGRFEEEVMGRLGMDVSVLPRLTKGFSCLGDYRGIPVGAALGDSQASFLGSVGMRENAVLVNVGTGGQVSVLSQQYFEAPGIEARPLTEGKYLLTGSCLCGGRAYAILERFLRSYAKEAGAEEVSQYEIMERLARRGRQQRQGAMKVTTAFCGSRTNPELRGSITNIGEDNFTPQGLVYGVLEGMAQELFDLYQVIRREKGICAQYLTGSGNGLRKNQVLQEIFSDLFGTRLRPAPYQEEAACGAALMNTII